MAAKSYQRNVKKIHTDLDRLEKKVVQFGGVHDEIAKDINEVRKYVNEQKVSADAQQRAELITGLGNVVATSINSLDDLTSGEPKRVLKGSMNIATSIASVVGGMFSAVAGALCSILGAVVSAFSPKEPDLATKFAQLVRVELQKFHRKLRDEHFTGLQHRVAAMNNTLKRLSKEGSESGITNLIDNTLYETDLPQFIGEVSYNIAVGLTRDSSKEDIEDCVRSMVVYCIAQTVLLILLANIMTKLTTTGQKTTALQSFFDAEKKNARDMLAFLSDEINLGPVGYLPTEGEKIYMIIALRGNIPEYEIVESFRVSLGLSNMADIDELQKRFSESDLYEVKSIIELYPAPHRKQDNHYFQFINHTDLPVKVDCGLGGDNVNGLEFKADVKRRSSYEHIAAKSGWTFSTCGYFIIYLDGQMQNYDKRFNGSIRVYEFSLSNPACGSRKAKILDKSENVFSVNGIVDGSECWNGMDSEFVGDPIYFRHGKSHYMLTASLGESTDKLKVLSHYRTNSMKANNVKNINFDVIFQHEALVSGIVKKDYTNDDNGKNGYYTWRFVLQDFDPIKDIQLSNWKKELKELFLKH